jgi:hypothetical protein
MNRSMPPKFGTCSRIVQQIIKKLKLFGKYMKTSNILFCVTGLTVIETLAVLLVELLSFAVNVKLSDPVYPLFGV